MNKQTAKKLASLVEKLDAIKDQMRELLETELQDQLDKAQERLDAAEEYQDEHPNSARAEERMEKAQENFDAIEEEYNAVEEYVSDLDCADYDNLPEAVTELLFC